jgi:hypothetical protein
MYPFGRCFVGRAEARGADLVGSGRLQRHADDQQTREHGVVNGWHLHWVSFCYTWIHISMAYSPPRLIVRPLRGWVGRLFVPAELA